MKVIVLHHRLAGFSAHHYNEAIGLIEEAARRGWELDLIISWWASDDVRGRLAPFARAVFKDPAFDLSRTFEQRVDAFVQQIQEHVEPALTPGSRVMVTIATQVETCALVRWASTLPPERMPQIVILHLSDRWNRAGARPDEPAELAGAGRELARSSPAARDRITICAATAGLAAELSRRMDTHVRAAPVHLNYRGLAEIARARSARATPPRPTIGFLGGARPEKGSHRWAEIVAACRSRSPMRFVVQAFNEGIDPAAFERLRALGELDDVMLVEHPPERDEWESMLARIDVMVLPYERINYRQRNSGIFAEGIAAGLPGVVPSGTWLADQITSGRAAGVVYDGTAPDAAADAVARCVADLDALTRLAGTRAAAWRESESLGAFLDAVDAFAGAAVR